MLAFAVTLIALLTSAASAQPQPPELELCRRLLGTAEPSLAAHQASLPKFTHRTDRYRLGGVREFPIRNQCNYGSCWLHAGLVAWEERFQLNTGRQVELSEDYLIARKIIHQALEKIREQSGFTKPGYPVKEVDELVRLYGLMPKSAWRPKVSFGDDPGVAARIHFHVNVIVHNAIVQARKAESGGEPLDLAETERKLKDAVQSFTGAWPEEFEFERKRTTPKRFAGHRGFRPPKAGLRALARKHLPANQFRVEYLAERIIDQLERTGQGVPVSLGWEEAFYGRREGILSMAAFHDYDNRPSMRKLMREIAGGSDDQESSHALYVVDYELDERGRVVKFLVANSWGPNAGDQGFLHVYWDYFSTYLTGIGVYENPAEERREELEAAFGKTFEFADEEPKLMIDALGSWLKRRASLSDAEFLHILERMPEGTDWGSGSAWRAIREGIQRKVGKSWGPPQNKDQKTPDWESADLRLVHEALLKVRKVRDRSAFLGSIDRIMELVDRGTDGRKLKAEFREDLRRYFVLVLDEAAGPLLEHVLGVHGLLEI